VFLAVNFRKFLKNLNVKALGTVFNLYIPCFSWQHSIPSRKFDNVNGEIHERQDRISLTFRKCVSKETAGNIIERCLVKNTYDHIDAVFF